MVDFVVMVILLAAEAALGAFIYYYGTRPAPGTRFRRKFSRLWMSTPIGVVLMSQKIAWFFVVAFILLSRFVGDFPGRDVIALVLYTLLVSLFWAVFGVLRHTQLPFEREQRRSPEAVSAPVEYVPNDWDE